MVRHYSLPRRSREEIMRRHRSGLYLGPGQVLRHSLGHGLFLAHLWRFRLFVAYISMCAAGIGALLLGASAGLWRPSVLWALLAAVAVAGLAAKKRSLREAGLSLFAWTLVAAGMIRGFARAPRPAETYPVPEARAPGAGPGDRGSHSRIRGER